MAVSLSKGLGAPGGSLLAGSKALVGRAVRHRRMLGGAMRQTGIYAAAGLHALDQHMARLPEDHANARAIAERLAQSAAIELDLATVQTNVVVFRLRRAEAPAFVGAARAAGVLVNALGPRTVRALTHLDVDATQCRRAADVLLRIADASG